MQMHRYLDDSISFFIGREYVFVPQRLDHFLAVFQSIHSVKPVQAPQYPVQSNSSPRVSVMHGWTILILTHHPARAPLRMGRCEISNRRTAPL